MMHCYNETLKREDLREYVENVECVIITEINICVF